MFNPKMLKKVQQIKRQMEQVEEELQNERVEATAGGGMVKVVATGKQDIVEVKINRDVVDPEEVELLEDMVLAAVKDALKKSRELAQQKMAGLTGGINIPGMV